MCDPISIGVATFALGAAQSVSQYEGQNAVHKATTVAANYNYAREMGSLNRQNTQLEEEHSQQALDTALTTLKAKGDIAASASDSGLAQSSLVSQVNASMFGIGRQASVDEQNFQNQRLEIADNRTDAAIKRQNQINSAPKATTASLVLGLGKSALAGVNAYGSSSRAGA